MRPACNFKKGLFSFIKSIPNLSLAGKFNEGESPYTGLLKMPRISISSLIQGGLPSSGPFRMLSMKPSSL